MYYTLKNPDVMRKLREEVDSVCGDERITAAHLGKLNYLNGMWSFPYNRPNDLT